MTHRRFSGPFASKELLFPDVIRNAGRVGVVHGGIEDLGILRVDIDPDLPETRHVNGLILTCFLDDIPPKVSIQEAVLLAERYGGDDSPRFVNGVLDALFKDAASSG